MESSERTLEKVFPNGDVYRGDFEGLLPQGKGIYNWSDGTVYDGHWEEGKMTGKGRIFWPSGNTYEGDFSANYLHGFGAFTYSDGSLYRGGWRLNLQHGIGRKKYHNTDVYDGCWKEGIREGSGRYAWSNGNMYIGSWKNGKMSGRGVMKWTNGDLFDGLWLNGLRHGTGCYRFSDGSYYFGTWTKGLKDGRGTLYPAKNKHLSLRKSASEKNADKKKRQLVHSSSLSSEKSVRPSVRRSHSEKKSNTLLRNSGQISRRTSSLGEDSILDDVSVDVTSHDSSSMLSLHSDDDQSELLGNGTIAYEREYMQGVLIKERIRSVSGLSLKLKKRCKFHAEEVKMKSCVDVFEGHKSYYLMLNLQLGIRYTVGKITPVPARDVRSSDFGERARIRMYFPRKGSQFTPPHHSIDFYWMDYCPMVFRNLREMFKLNAADYMMSICGDDGLREISSPGKSGSIFYLSGDDRFVIKTLKRAELKVFLGMLPRYYEHVKEHENTLITKFFGLHRIILRHGKKVRFVVMGNMFCTELRIHRRYDLKGSTYGRFTRKDKINEGTTLKDLDLTYEFHMDELLHQSLFKQLSLDCKFLESQQIIDYSLLLGLHFRAPENLTPLLEPPDSPHKSESAQPVVDGKFEGMNSVGELPIPPRGLLLVTHEPSSVSTEPGPHIRGMNSVGELPIPPRGLLLVTHEPSSVSTEPGPHIRGSTLRAMSVGDKEVDLLLPGTARLRVQLGVNMPAEANHKLWQDESDPAEAELFEVYDVVLYLGIIDILQEYNIRKKLEHTCKSLQHDPMSISVIEPKLYSKRFINFLEKVFPVVQ